MNNLLNISVDNLTTVNGVLASLVVVLIAAVGFLYKQVQEKNNLHISDIKLFDNENKKDKRELLEILNKFHLSIEEEKIVDKSIIDKLDRAISLLESQLRNS